MVRRVAFVVGSNGPTTWIRLKPLAFARSDAQSVAGALSSDPAGYEVICRTEEKNPFALIKELGDLSSSLDYDDHLLMYFSGHGVVRKSQLYLLVDDAVMNSLDVTSINYNLVHDILRNCPADHRIIILDCCHAGEAVTTNGEFNLKGNFSLDAVERSLKGSGSSILMACGPDAAARESERFGGGILTHLILEALSPARLPEVADRETGLLSMDGLRDWLWGRIDQLRSEGVEVERPILQTVGHTKNYLTAVSILRNKHLLDVEAHIKELEGEYALVPKLETKTLERLARPLSALSRRIKDFSFAADLLVPVDDKSLWSAQVFVATVLIYHQARAEFLDQVISLLGTDHSRLRGSAMWRVLRALKRLIPEEDVTPVRRQAIADGLRQCAQAFDSKEGQRFIEQNCLRKIFEIAETQAIKFADDGYFQCGSDRGACALA